MTATQKCKRCGTDEWRQDGYCSCECQDLHEVELDRDASRAQCARKDAEIARLEAAVADWKSLAESQETVSASRELRAKLTEKYGL
jgi:uncharacterized Zn finger protein (UPF0148 family)